MVRRVTISSVPLDVMTREQVVAHVHDQLDRGRGGMLVTPNLDIIRLLQRPTLRDIATAAELMVCDGAPVLWATRLAGTPLPERVTGSDLIWSLSKEAGVRGRSVYIIGGPPGTAQSALLRLAARFPGLRAAGASAPNVRVGALSSELTDLVTALKDAQPDIVYVCLGFPKQELLAMQLLPQMPGTWFIGCGAAVEFVAGTRRRAPRWLQNLGAEWLWRLWQEPRRLGPRYARDAAFGLKMLVTSALARREPGRFVVQRDHDDETARSGSAR